MAPALATRNRPAIPMQPSTSLSAGWTGLQSRSQCDEVRAYIRRAIRAGEIRVRPNPRNPDKIVITSTTV